MTTTRTTAPVRRFAANTSGRDFVAGDIHGEFSRLEACLEGVAFAPERDRLFSVGDLIDRGPDSPAALEWLARPWFHAVRGNHEEMALQAEHDPDMAEAWLWNGGEWWLAAGPALRRALRPALRRLPLAIEVAGARERRYGIVHADLPPGRDWDGFLRDLERGDPVALEYALWSRSRALRGSAGPVAGVCAVYCGHTPLPAPRRVGNVHFIDTGACYRGTLTLLRLGAEMSTA